MEENPILDVGTLLSHFFPLCLNSSLARVLTRQQNHNQTSRGIVHLVGTFTCLLYLHVYKGLAHLLRNHSKQWAENFFLSLYLEFVRHALRCRAYIFVQILHRKTTKEWESRSVLQGWIVPRIHWLDEGKLDTRPFPTLLQPHVQISHHSVLSMQASHRPAARQVERGFYSQAWKWANTTVSQNRDIRNIGAHARYETRWECWRHLRWLGRRNCQVLCHLPGWFRVARIPDKARLPWQTHLSHSMHTSCDLGQTRVSYVSQQHYRR